MDSYDKIKNRAFMDALLELKAEHEAEITKLQKIIELEKRKCSE